MQNSKAPAAEADISSAKTVHQHLVTLAEATDEIVNATGQAFYVWDIASDRIEWSRNFEKLVGLKNAETRHLSGRKYESMLGSQSRETRFGVIVSAERKPRDGNAVPYQFVYLLQPDPESDASPLWIEDTGSWFADATGRPLRAEGTIRIINDRRQREEDLRRQSDFDDLTGLPNRRSLEVHVTKAIENAAREGVVSSLMILSIDRMDLVNDIHGFSTGDYVLKKVGEMIRSKLRADDIVCRFSGAKFGIVLSQCPPAEIYDAGNRLLKAISADVLETPDGAVALSGVIGACFLPKHADTPKQAIHAAMKAVKNAKTEVSRRVSVFTHCAKEEEETRLKSKFSSDVIAAINEKRIHLAFQPVCRSDGSIAFHETLVRMEKPNGDIEEAGNFIAAVEQLGLIGVVDKFALKLVLETLVDYPDAVISVNISQDTVLDPDWLSELATGLALTKNGARRLIVEVTESMALTDISETKRFFDNLHALGCRIAIDDFGAGFTSFSYLKDLPVDLIKIDGSYGTGLADSPQNQAFVKALLSLAKFFEIETVVEWVEDRETSKMIAGWDVDYQQGHQFGRPVSTPPWIKADRTV